MYSGTTITNLSGSVIGAHQKIDKTAHRHLGLLVGDAIDGFPKKRDILHFEGKNGPDGIKSKSPSKDEPWHFYDPFDEDDSKLLDSIGGHYDELVRVLKKGEPERAAFDAAWLAHAIVDGLTPAHHFPYEEKLIELRGVDSGERDSIRNKLIIPGDNMKEVLRKNWEMWGIGGLMSLHGSFELGIAAMIAPLRLTHAMPSESDLELMVDVGYVEYFKRSARAIALMDMYSRFADDGWMPGLIRDVRNELAPTLVRTVTVCWYSAMRDAGLLKK